MKKNIIFVLLFIFLILIIKHSTSLHIKAQFQELRPIHEKLDVYYKGIIVGSAHQIRHSKDFKHTYINILLHKKGIMLPVNTEILLKKEKRNKKEKDFLELIYPKEPKNEILNNGSIIKGIATTDVETYILNQHPDDLEQIKENLVQSSKNLANALYNLNELFIALNDLVRDNEIYIQNSFKNLEKTTNNLNKSTNKINNSIKEKELKNILSQINSTSNNFNLSSENLNTYLPETLKNTKDITSNISVITCAIRKTLTKSFGGLRLIFGKAIE